MSFVICFAFLFFAVLCQIEREHNLYFVNVKTDSTSGKQSLVVIGMDIDTKKFEEYCDFGSEFVAPYQTFKDYENLRTGSGCIDADFYNQYTVFLHDDVDNRDHGVVMKCQLDSKEATILGTYDFSCDYMDGDGGVTFQCASTVNDTVGTSLKMLYPPKKEIDEYFTIPYYAKTTDPLPRSTCYFDPEQDNYNCYSYKLNNKNDDEDDDSMHYSVSDCGVPKYHRYWEYKITNQVNVYTISAVDINDNMIAIIEYKDIIPGEGEAIIKKAVVQLVYNSTGSGEEEFYWVKVGDQELMNEMKYFYSNGITNCPDLRTLYFKAMNSKDRKQSLIFHDFDKGSQEIIDTSSIGEDLTFVSQFACA